MRGLRTVNPVVKHHGFTLVELLVVLALLTMLSVMFYNDAKEQARIIELTAYSEEAQNLVNALDFNREYSLSDEFLLSDIEIFCAQPAIDCSYQEQINGSELTLTLNTPEGQWRYWGAESTTVGSGDALKTVLTFYPRKKTAISSQYSFFPVSAAKQQF